MFFAPTISAKWRTSAGSAAALAQHTASSAQLFYGPV